MATRIVDNKSLADKESRILPLLKTGEQQSYAALRAEAVKIEMKNPNLDTSANTRFISDYLDAALSHRRKIDSYLNNARTNGIVPDSRATADLSRKLRNDYFISYARDVVPSYGEQGKLAHEKLMSAVRGDTIPEAIVGQFYKSEEGGMRWGGIAGGLIAGVLAFTQMGGMGGGLMGIAVAAIAAVAGAWLMNKGVDTVSGYMQQNKAENKPPAMQRAPSRNFDNMASRSNEPIKLPELQGEIIPNQMIIATADASPDRLLSSPQTPAAAPKSGPQRS